MLEMKMTLKNETKTCYRFEHREGGELTTLYLKKNAVLDAGIDPAKGITLTIAVGENEGGKSLC